MSQQQTECQAQQYAHYNSKLSSDQLRKPGAYKWTGSCKMRPVTQQSMKDPHEAAEDTSTTPRCRKHPHHPKHQEKQARLEHEHDGNHEGDQRNEKKGTTTRASKMGKPAWQVGCQ